MYIGYDVKGGIRYAKLCVSERVDGKVRTTQKSLGRVLDERSTSTRAGNAASSPMTWPRGNTGSRTRPTSRA
jgi:hypothetical protein